MANQTETDAASGARGHGAVATAPGGSLAAQPAAHGTPFPPFHGRAVSWVAVSIVMVGFLVGALGLVLGSHGPVWWLFWTGSGVAVLGLLLSVATNTFEDWY